MPGMDGFQVCEKLKAHDRLRLIPVIFLTAMRTTHESRIKALEMGAEGFLSKPFNTQELMAQIQVMTKIKRANHDQLIEKERLAVLVTERTRELKEELDERHRTEAALLRANQQLEQNQIAMLNLLEDLNKENEVRREAELALKRSASLLRASLEATDDGIVVVDNTGRIESFNNRFAELWHLPLEMMECLQFDNELLGTVLDQLADSEAFLVKVRSLYSQPDSQSFDVVEFKDGRIFERHSHPQLLEGKPVGRVWSFRDVTERKQAEDALQSSRNMLAQVLDAVPQSVFWKDRNSVYMGCNEIFSRSAGLANPKDIVGKNDFDLPWADTGAKAFVKDDKEVIESKQSKRHIIEQVQQADGTRLWADTSKVPLHDGDGNVYGVLGVFEDITKRKQAEEANQRLMVAIDQAAESIVFTDLDGKILYVNQGFEKATGYTRQEALGQNPRILKSGSQTAGFYKSMWEMLIDGKVWHGRFTNKRKDGTFYEEEATISPVRNSEGKIASYVAVKRDVSREVLLERQFIEAQKMEAIGHLAGGIAHDFNNILAVNMMQLSLLLEDSDLTPSLREALETLQKGEDRAASLTRQLLMFSRRQVLQIKPVELNGLVEDEFKMLRRLLGEQIDLSVQTHAQPAWIEVDTGMIEQVVMNLCINARDAMPNGGSLTVKIKPVELATDAEMNSIDARPGKFVCLTVADSGCGMSMETLQRIFEPFFTTKEVGKGTGLGLATVYGIIKQHKGWIEVESEVGVGTVFRVFLPACEIVPPDKAGINSKGALSGHETILFVEDDASVRKIVVIGLERLGYHVIIAKDGADAMCQWEQHHEEISLLLTDMVMPGGISGLDLAKTLKQKNPNLKVLISSGYSIELNPGEEDNGLGATYLTKPYQFAMLSTALRQSLDHS